MFIKAKNIKVGDSFRDSKVAKVKMNKMRTIVFIELENGNYYPICSEHKIEVFEREENGRLNT